MYELSACRDVKNIILMNTIEVLQLLDAFNGIRALSADGATAVILSLCLVNT